MLRLSVVLCTYNRRKVIERTLPTLLGQDLDPQEFEIIYVVDGSRDGTAELLSTWESRCRLRVVEAEHRGPSAARNVGIRAAEGELILILDDDLLCPPDLFSQHLAAHNGPEPRVVHGPIYVAPDSAKTLIRHVTETFYEAYYRPLSPETELRYPTPIDSHVSVISSLVNSSMPRRVLLEAGEFDEEIRAAEDLELGLRLWKAGCHFQHLPSAGVLEYYIKTSLQYLHGQAVSAAAGDIAASRKHPEYRRHCSLAPLGEKRGLRGALLKALACSPISPLPLIEFPLLFERWMYSSARLRRAGVRLLQVAEMITRFRAAVRVTGSWRALKSEYGLRCPVLMYHHVGPAREGMYRELYISEKMFERQIRWLAARGYTGVLPADLLRWLKEGRGLPKKPILITFDDAYADVAEFALPILRRHGFGGAIYVVTGRLGATNTWDEVNGSGTLRLMTGEQIQYWAENGIDFGAHSRTHANLTTLSQSELMDEVSGSKKDLDELLRKPTVSFAYPYGEFDDASRDIVQAEFELGISTIDGVNCLSTDPQLLRRIYVGPHQSLAEFVWNVYRGSSVRWIDKVRGRVALRTRLRKLLHLHRPRTAMPDRSDAESDRFAS